MHVIFLVVETTQIITDLRNGYFQCWWQTNFQINFFQYFKKAESTNLHQGNIL